MKLLRFGVPGKEKPGFVDRDGNWRETSAFGEDYNEQFFQTEGLQRLEHWIESHSEDCRLIAQNSRLGPPIARPSKLICIGLNYAGHAIESGIEIPREPVVFFKATSAICGPNDDLIIPRGSQKTDWEVELAVVIGRKANYIGKVEAMDYVAGYMVHNDYSEREYQLERGGQWVKGKSADTFAPLGPYMVTKDEIPDVSDLDLWLKVNDVTVQQGSTSDLIFDIPTLVSYLSNYMSLLPGDIISTGTPQGVGLGMNPPVFLKPGDTVELGIKGLGSSKQEVKKYI
jgi:2,4-diketo-3-deoxy-L-fuconate hydrolase